jgi:hypothetical protein
MRWVTCSTMVFSFIFSGNLVTLHNINAKHLTVGSFLLPSSYENHGAGKAFTTRLED